MKYYFCISKHTSKFTTIKLKNNDKQSGDWISPLTQKVHFETLVCTKHQLCDYILSDAVWVMGSEWESHEPCSIEIEPHEPCYTEIELHQPLSTEVEPWVVP